MKKSTHLLCGLLWLVLVSAIGYLLCSLFSLSFDMDEWNLFSNIVKWIVIVGDVLILKDAIFEQF